MSDAAHPFERKGLGSAPFRFVALRRGPGGCAHCGRLIAWLCTVADADGREFVVGTDCVQRTCGSGRFLDEMERELRHARKLEAAERHEARRLACLSALQADPDFLTDRPHPDAWRAGKTLRDGVVWLFRTQAGRAKAFRIIEAALAEHAAKPDSLDVPTRNHPRSGARSSAVPAQNP